MIKAEKLAAEFRRLLLGDPIIRRAHHESSSRSLFRRIGQRDSCGHPITGTDERSAALMRIGLFAMTPNSAVHSRVDQQRLRFCGLSHQSAFQNFSVKYFSAPSGQTVTMIPVLSCLATCRTAETAAPEEMPAMTPSSRASRRTISNASS